MQLNYDSVVEMVEKTNRSLFVTGKAGTGKTTLLRRIVQNEFKKAVVVAPTGVAAINAEGMTIHSFFQLPIDPVLPTAESYRSLIASQKIRSRKRSLFKEIELLIIDEVSMVRADLLDEIDAVLRHYRHRRDVPFGGVQVVFFGDLYQLPPVVTEAEMRIMGQYYNSLYFFNAHVIQEARPVMVELDTIFRQKDKRFIELLAQIRNNSLTPEMFELIKSRLDTNYNYDEMGDSVVLTTHNAKADAVNQEQLSKLKTKIRKFKAKIEDEFPEKSYPTDGELELAVGARVMFVMNDKQPEKRFYNGMIGEIEEIGQDGVLVRAMDSGDKIEVGQETWENRVYDINKETNEIVEKTIGKFHQLPLRLAWAITIHKSQGLTFDKVVIDSSAAFASGQVYVAFSRCRTLEGITLTSLVNPTSLRVDGRISSYCNTALPPEAFEEQLKEDKQAYGRQVMIDLYDLRPFYAMVLDLKAKTTGHSSSFSDGFVDFIETLANKASSMASVASKFAYQLQTLQLEDLPKRVEAAAGYFGPLLDETVDSLRSGKFVSENQALADIFEDSIKEIFEFVDKKRFIIKRCAADCSVDNFFEVRRNFRPEQIEVKSHSANAEYSADSIKNFGLFKRLRAWRNEQSKEEGVTAFQIFSNKALQGIAESLPQNNRELAKVNGVGKKKIERYGNACLEMVREYCKKKNIPISQEIEVEEEEKPEKKSTFEITLEMLKEGKSVEEIAEERNLKHQTIMGHLCKFIEKGQVDGADYVDMSIYRLVCRKLKASNGEMTMTDLFNSLGGRIPYDELNMAHAYWINQKNNE